MLLVKNGWIVTLNDQEEVVKDGGVVIDGREIREVGKTADLIDKYPNTQVIDARGKLVMPGMINTHMHLYSTFARGMALKDAPPENFRQILERLWWRLDRQLTEDDLYYSAMLPLLDCIRYGTTTILDHHASPGVIRGSLDILAEVAQKLGVRGSFAYEVSDRDGQEKMRAGVEENLRFIKKYTRNGQIVDGDSDSTSSGLIHGLFGLHASMTLSDETLAYCREGVEGLGIGFHVHTAEGFEDLEDSLQRSGMRVVERLDQFGIWNERSLAVHCVQINEAEMAILKERGTFVVHNPESNMGNAVGCANVTQMLQQGLTVGLGTDGFTVDQFESVKVANLLHKHVLRNPSASWAEVPQLIFTNNSQIVSQYFSKPVGKLVPGGLADLIITDYDPPTPLDQSNYYGHILFGVNGGRVVTTIINGRVVMQDRVILGVDEEAIHARGRELAQKLWKRF